MRDVEQFPHKLHQYIDSNFHPDVTYMHFIYFWYKWNKAKIMSQMWRLKDKNVYVFIVLGAL